MHAILRYPLRYMLPLAILLVALVSSSFVYVFNSRARNRIIEVTELRDLGSGMHRRQARMEEYWRTGAMDRVRREIAVIVLDDPTDNVVVVNAQQEIIGASTPAWAGMPFAKAPLLAEGKARLALAFAGQGQEEKKGEFLTQDRKTIYAISPLMLRPAGGNGLPTVVGMLYHEHDLRKDKALGQMSVRKDAFLIFCVIATLALGVWCYFNLVFSRRVKVIINSLDRFGSGERTVQAEVDGADELAHIAQALNGMIVFRNGAEKQIREDTTLLKQLTDGLPVLIAYVDKDERYRLVNQEFEKWFYLKPSQLIGRQVDELLGDKGLAEIAEHVHQALRGMTVEYESAIPTVNNGMRQFHATLLPHLDNSHGVRGCFLLAQDITQHKIDQEQLEQAKESWEHTFDAIVDEIITVQDKEFHIQQANSIAATHFGIPREAIIGRHCYELFWERDSPCTECPSSAVFQDGKPHSAELYHARLQKDFLVTISPMTNEMGEIIGIVHAAKDITELKQKINAHKQAEAALLKSDGHLHDLLTSVTSYMYTVVMDGNHAASTTHGPGCLAVSGFSADDYAADPDLWLRMIHPEDRQAVLEAVQQVLTSQVTNTLEHRIQHKDGSLRWVQTTLVPHLSPEGQLLSYDGLINDITERKRTEEVQLFLAQTTSGRTAREPFFKALARYLAQSLGMDFVCIDRLAGGGLTARTLAVWCDGHFQDNVTYALKETPCGAMVGKEVCCFPSEVCQLFPNDQTLKNLRAESYVGVTLFSHSNQPIGLISVIGRQALANQPMAESLLRLVSVRAAGELERQDAEESLRESEEKYRTLADFTYDWEYWIGSDGQFIYCSAACERISSYRAEEFIHDPDLFTTIVHPDDRSLVQAHNEKLSDPGSPCESSLEFRILTRLGEVRWLAHNCVPVYDRNGNYQGRRACNRDITERKGLETQLRQAQKMEAIGTLAGGIAHDFNNILTPILGYSELVIERLPESSNEHGLVQEILKAGKRAKELVKQILTFSRQSEQQLKPVMIHLIVKEALKLLRSSIPTTIAIKQNVGDCGLVMADPTQIHQILMNLCTNAYHAMQENGGELDVSLSVVEITAQDYLDNLALQPGPHVKLSVRDTGCGITKELQERIFEPYFTTKKQGEGTGLGLSVVHGIVQSHHGHITVYSEPGQGTEFHVYLPQVKTQNGGSAEDSGAVAIPRGSGTILLVDDEVAVGQMLRELLLSMGYEVMLCSSSAQALETFMQNGAHIDLVFTDMTMPGMNGAELARRIKQLNPTMPVVLCTGFSDIMDEEKAKRMGIDGYLLKPVIKRQLAQTIHEVMAKRLKI